MQWGEGFRRLGVAFGIVYWGVVAFFTIGAWNDGGRVSEYVTPETYNTPDGHCFTLATPYGRRDLGQRVADAEGRRMTQANRKFGVPIRNEAGDIVDVESRCKPLPQRFWYAAAWDRAKETVVPAFWVWVVLWVIGAGLAWVAKGFAKPRDPAI